MDVRKIQCHRCKLFRERNMIINCSKKDCQTMFCLFCFEEKFGNCSYPFFLKQKASNKWKCFKCKKVCNCDDCLNKMNLNNEKEIQLLNNKRNRFKKHFIKKPNPIKQKNLLNKNIQNEFPNFNRNKDINKIVIRAAIISHLLKICKIKKFSNKPCLICNKFKCPKDIEILKFKSIDEVRIFLETFFIEFEDEMKRGILNIDLMEILEKKTNLYKIKQILETIPCKERLRIPKRICSNCFTSLLFEQNGLLNFANLFKEEDEVVKLNIKQKLEIINGMYNLIKKEIKKKNMKNEILYGFLNNYESTQNFEQNNQINIFNSIFNHNKNINCLKNESKDNFSLNSNNNNNNNCNIHKESFTLYIPNGPLKSNLKNQNQEYYDSFKFTSNNINDIIINKMNYLWNNKRSLIHDNIYNLLLNKISVNVSETINLLMSIQNKLFEYMNSQNNDMIYNEIILINELIKMKSNIIKNSLYDYNRELLSLPNYLYINSFSLIN